MLGARLEEMINEDKHLEPSISAMLNDETKQRELLLQDEEEDFLDEGNIQNFFLNTFINLETKVTSISLVTLTAIK